MKVSTGVAPARSANPVAVGSKIWVSSSASMVLTCLGLGLGLGLLGLGLGLLGLTDPFF